MQMILKIKTPDQKGLIAEITRVIFEFNLNILKNDEFVDKENNLFFMRSEMEGDCSIKSLQKAIRALLSPQANIEVFEAKRKKNRDIMHKRKSLFRRLTDSLR